MHSVTQWFFKMKLIAKVTIKHGGEVYKPGETLEADEKNAKFLLDSKSAIKPEAAKAAAKITEKAK